MYNLEKVIGKQSKEFILICTSLKIIFKSLKCKQLNFWKIKLKYQKSDNKFASIWTLNQWDWELSKS